MQLKGLGPPAGAGGVRAADSSLDLLLLSELVLIKENEEKNPTFCMFMIKNYVHIMLSYRMS